MKWSALFLLGLTLLACDSHKVEQIDVEVPAGVTVPEDMVFIPSGEFIMGHPEDAKTSPPFMGRGFLLKSRGWSMPG